MPYLFKFFSETESKHIFAKLSNSLTEKKKTNKKVWIFE